MATGFTIECLWRPPQEGNIEEDTDNYFKAVFPVKPLPIPIDSSWEIGVESIVFDNFYLNSPLELIANPERLHFTYIPTRTTWVSDPFFLYENPIFSTEHLVQEIKNKIKSTSLNAVGDAPFSVKTNVNDGTDVIWELKTPAKIRTQELKRVADDSTWIWSNISFEGTSEKLLDLLGLNLRYYDIEKGGTIHTFPRLIKDYFRIFLNILPNGTTPRNLLLETGFYSNLLTIFPNNLDTNFGVNRPPVIISQGTSQFYQVQENFMNTITLILRNERGRALMVNKNSYISVLLNIRPIGGQGKFL